MNDIKGQIKIITDVLGVERINIIAGGPCIADPAGLQAHCLSVVDKNNNGWYVSISDDGLICECGANINGRKVTFPKVEVLKFDEE